MWLPVGRELGEGEIESLGLADATGIYRMDKDNVLLYSTGNYTQYPVINHNGKEYEKECEYIYIYIYKTESLFYRAEVNTF